MVFTKLASLLALAGVVAADQWGLPTNQGTYLQNATFDGPNPTNVGYYVYVPPKVVKNAPLLVVAHWCTGSANDIYKYNQFPTYADKYGFVIIFPSSPNLADHCWDLSSKQTLTHNGGGDAQGIASMIQYTIKKYEADPSRVFMTGISSGGMMTEHMMGVYPNLFAAGVAIASVPYSCFTDPNGGFATWSNACVDGKVTHTGAEWAKIVHDAYPSYTGYRPHLQLYHGTKDQVVSYVNFGESIKEWTSVYGISETPVETDLDTPLTGWTKTVYGNGELQAFSCKDVPHDVPFRQDDIAAYFQLTCPPGDASCFRRPDHPTPEPTPVPTSSTPAPTTVTTAPSTTPTTSAPANGVPRWGQCGGIGYSGPTVCKEGTCTKANDWYSQCI